MFELFHNTFTYGYNFKVNVKFKVKYKEMKKGLLEISFWFCNTVHLKEKKYYIAK